MRANVCTDAGIHMCTDMCTDMCSGMCTNMCIDMRMGMCRRHRLGDWVGADEAKELNLVNKVCVQACVWKFVRACV